MSLWHMTLLNFSQLEDALKNGRFYLCVPLFEVFSLHFCLRTPNCGPILNTNNTNLKDAILKTNCIKHCKLIIVLMCVKYKSKFFSDHRFKNKESYWDLKCLALQWRLKTKWRPWSSGGYWVSCIPIQTQSQTVSTLTFFLGVIWIGDALKTLELL